jgi:hypothetical protein
VCVGFDALRFASRMNALLRRRRLTPKPSVEGCGVSFQLTVQSRKLEAYATEFLILHHAGNRLAKLVHASFAHSGNVDSSAANDIDAVLAL